MESNNATGWWVGGSVVGAVLLILASIFLFHPDDTANSQKNTEPVDIAKVNMQDKPFIGSINAPIIMAVWSDYQCPFCKDLAQGALSQVIANEVKAGTVKIVYKDLAFLGPDSTAAALVSRAVWEVAPDKFQAWHDAMFAKQDAENAGWGKKEDVLAVTESLGIDVVKINQLLDEKGADYQADIEADKAEANAFGITATPTTMIGKQLLKGAESYDAFKKAFENSSN